MYVFIKYIICASFAFLADANLFFYLVNNYQIQYLYANSISVFIGSVINFLLVRNFVFGKSSRYNDLSAFMLTILVSLIALIINNLSLIFFYELFMMELLFAKIIASLIGLIINFILRRDFVFK